MISKAFLTFAALCASVTLLAGCSNTESSSQSNTASSASFASGSGLMFGDESTITLDTDALQSASVLFDQGDNPGFALVFAECTLRNSDANAASNVSVQGDNVFVRTQGNADTTDPTTLLDETVGTALEANTEDGIENFTLAIKVGVPDDEAKDLADGATSAETALIDRARDTLAGCSLAITSDSGETTYSFEA